MQFVVHSKTSWSYPQAWRLSTLRKGVTITLSSRSSCLTRRVRVRPPHKFNLMKR